MNDNNDLPELPEPEDDLSRLTKAELIERIQESSLRVQGLQFEITQLNYERAVLEETLNKFGEIINFAAGILQACRQGQPVAEASIESIKSAMQSAIARYKDQVGKPF